MNQIKEPLNSSEINGSFLHQKLIAWYAAHERPLPWRVLWKKHRDPWHIWVSEIMLQQTVIKAVIPVYERFLGLFPSPSTLANAPSEDVRLAVRGLGYYRRFDLLHQACIKLNEEMRTLPNTHRDWLELPGIGDYTAAAIASITAGEPHGVVDGNVERVLCRIQDIRTEPNLPQLKKRFKIQMDQMCQRGSPGNFNQAVMELGQTVCLPANPACDRCPVAKECKSFKNKSQHLAPAQKSKTKVIAVSLRLGILHYRKKVLLFKRPDDAMFLKGSWGFMTDVESGNRYIPDGRAEIAIKYRTLRNLGTIRHSITKHKITAKVTVADCLTDPHLDHIRLFNPAEVEQNLVSNLDRKAWLLMKKIFED